MNEVSKKKSKMGRISLLLWGAQILCLVPLYLIERPSSYSLSHCILLLLVALSWLVLMIASAFTSLSGAIAEFRKAPMRKLQVTAMILLMLANVPYYLLSKRAAQRVVAIAFFELDVLTDNAVKDLAKDAPIAKKSK